MIVLIGILKAKPGKEMELENTLKSIFPKVQLEKGTVEYVLHRAENDSSKFLFYEKYTDRKSLDYHMTTSYLQKLFAIIENLIVNKPQIELFEDIATIAET